MSFLALKQWTLNNVNYKFRPVFRFREMTPCVTAAHVPTEIWMARNFLNCGSRTLSIRDKAGYYKYDLGHFVGVYQGLFAERPELFALVDGKRIPEGFVGCWSNPEFTQYAVNRIVGIVKRGNLDLINAFPEDIRERCECPECTKNPDRSSRWYDYYKILIKEIRKQCPDVMFAGTGYAEYYQIPKTTIEGLEYVDICLNRCYVHKHDDPNCPENQKGFKHLKNWQKKTTIGLYGYEFDAIYPNPVYMPFWHMLEDQLQVCRDMNLIHVKTEQLIRWDENARREDIFNLIHRIAYYVYARLAWNPSASADAILRDFCEKVYGPAADIMYEYHDSMAKQWDSMKIHIATDTGASALPVAPAFINESIIAMAHDKFDKALKAAQGNPRVTADIELDRKLFAKWESLYLNVTANGLSICAQQMPEGNGFKDIPRQRMVDKKGQKLPYLDKYIILIVGDLNNDTLKFEGLETDVVNLQGSMVARYRELEKHSDFTLYNLGPTTNTTFIVFNMNTRKNKEGKYYVSPVKQRWFGDVNFRSAVDWAIDRENLVLNVLSGVGEPLYSAESISSIFLNEEIAKGHSQDITYAKELLKKSGFYLKDGKLYDKFGNRVEFELLTNAGNTQREATGVSIKEDLQQLGMKVNFKPVEFNSLVAKLSNTYDWDAILIALTGNPLEPHSGHNVWTSDGALHLFNQRSDEDLKSSDKILPFEKELDRIFKQAALELDYKKRKELYDRYQQIVAEQNPVIYLYSPANIVAIRKKFKNIYPTELGGILHNIEEVYID